MVGWRNLPSGGGGRVAGLWLVETRQDGWARIESRASTICVSISVISLNTKLRRPPPSLAQHINKAHKLESDPPFFFAFFPRRPSSHSSTHFRSRTSHTHTHTHDTVPPPNPTPAATKMFSLPSPPSSPKPPASQRRTAYSHTRVIPTLQRHETQLCDRRRGGANTLSFEELAAREELWASEASQESDGWRSDASYSSAASAK